jgi:glycosyltransferase involved in cell wall biosynthesis
MPAGNSPSPREPWILICGGFHTRGGMDRSNLALADRLLDRGHRVWLVGHEIDEQIAQRQGVTAVAVPRPAGSITVGESRLARRAAEVARQVKAANPDAIVVANGGNGISPDVNWVHYVHHASRFEDDGAPIVVRLKNRYAERVFRKHEESAIQKPKLVITNSELTRRHVVELLGVDAQWVATVYLGANAEWAPPGSDERRSARAWLNIADDVPVVAFVGALGHDKRKGFDTLWAAWREVSSDPAWNAHLVVAGGGRQVERWRRITAETGGRVHILGFTDRVRDLLAASDLLVSPVRYEPFGLNVTEAICRGVPAIVSANAGMAELYPPALRSWLLADATDHHELANKLKAWRRDIEGAQKAFAPFGSTLRQRSWQAMADDFIALVHARLRPSTGNTLVATQ